MCGMCKLFLISILMTTAPFAHGQMGVEPSMSSALILQTILGLAIVISAIFVFAWLAKKLQAHNFARGNSMQILGAMPVGTKEKAVLIHVNGQSILLGVAPGRVSALHIFDRAVALPEEVEDSEEVEKSEEQAEAEQECTVNHRVALLKTKSLSARSPSEFSKKLQAFLGSSKPQS